MTFKEKLQQEHPELMEAYYWLHHCPDSFGYEDYSDCGDFACDECKACWDREMPEEEEKRENE